MDRVEINGVWYVREDLTPVEKSINGFKFIDNQEYMERNVAHVETISYEDEDYLLELDGLVTQKLGILSMISLKIEDKNTGKYECWDNEIFLRGIAKLEQESIDSVFEEVEKITVTEELLNLVINLLKVGQDKGML
jgi:hypothetical protein